MSESLRAMLHRMADEIADKVGELLSEAAPKKPAPARRKARGPVIVKPEPREMTPEARERAERYVRRALGR